MRTTLQNMLLAASLAMLPGLGAAAEPARIAVAIDKPGHAIPETLWGIFFEDINLSADGGLYPELVRNRSFEDASEPENWTITGAEASIDNTKPLNPLNRRSLRLKLDGPFTLRNDGYWGMNAVKGERYHLKLSAFAADGFKGDLTARLVATNGQTLAGGTIGGLDSRWKTHTLTLEPSATDPQARLDISGDGKGVLQLDMVSLMPGKTWKGHGLRVDLAESLQQLQPKFLRFPGGCWVEGNDMAHMYQWKRTIGSPETRTPLWNIWGYYATHGIGYHEYLQLAEDLGAAPLFCINAGMSHREVIPLDHMGQWVQDALDALEYANGPVTSVWGAKRAAAGHPAPFNLKYLEIGNENGGPAYNERWRLFVQAIRARYPEVQLVANHWMGGFPAEPRPDIVDEHFYDTPEWFMRHATHYDKYDRKGPKIFVGEYAVTRNCGLGNLRGAIGEAAFMTGLERNSDHVIMASYAPLLVNLNHRAWNPDLINFDSSGWYGLPSYYVQKLFAENRGTTYLPVEVQSPLAETAPPGGRIGVGTWNTAAEFKDIRVTGRDGAVLFASDFSRDSGGWTLLGQGAQWKVQDGALRQGAEREFIRALAGKPEWRDYTLSLKARKLSGAEGFLVLFRIGGNEDRTWWNLGGWNNTAHAIEAGGTLGSRPGRIETGRWYDIQVKVSGKHVTCSLDGQVIHDLDIDTETKVPSLYATAATDKTSGDVILKVVNANTAALSTELTLSGGDQLSGRGTAEVLTSANATDENSLAEPLKVSPKKEPFSFSGTVLNRAFPPNSLTVLRLQKK